MGIFGRVVVNVFRNPAKSIILFVIIFVLGCVVSGAISVRQAIQNTDDSLRGNMPAVAIIETDSSALEEYAALTGSWPEDFWGLNPQILNEVGRLPYVKSFDYSVDAGLLSDHLERYHSTEHAVGALDMGEGWTHFHLKGVRSTDIFEMQEEIIELVAGRTFNEDEISGLSFSILVSQNFATTNNLHVGSTISLQNVVWDMQDVEIIDSNFYVEDNMLARRAYDFEIIGIFEPRVEFDTGDAWMDVEFLDQLENRFFASNNVSIEALDFQLRNSNYSEESSQNFWDHVWIQNIYMLNSRDDIDDFQQAAEKIIPEFYTVTFTSDAFGGVASSIDSLKGLASSILWAAIGAAAIILSLLVTLYVRDRKRELGILLALGAKKATVVIQVLIEVLGISLLAISLALVVGNVFSASISEEMFRNNLVAEHTGEQSMSYSNIDFMGFSNNVQLAEVLESYSVSLDASTIVFFFAISAGVIVLSVGAPMVYILRLNPRKIMM